MIVTPRSMEVHPDFFELLDYDPRNFRPDWLGAGDEKGADDAKKYASAWEFSQKTMVYCYQSIGLMVQGIHRPYIAKILMAASDKGYVSIIDVGSGGGQLALALHSLGFRVSLADIAGESLKFAEWRLRRRGLNLPVYILNSVPGAEIPHHNIATCFDVLEHLDSDDQWRLLQLLGEIADIVFVNAAHDEKHPGLHFPVDVASLSEKLAERGIVEVSDFYPDKNGIPRQHLLVYGAAVHA